MKEIDNLIEHANSKSSQRLLDYLVMTMGDDAETINAWLNTPKKALKNQTPSEQLNTEEGCERVIAMLRKILEQDSRIG
uniref:MbcA/ParS/Xre antitoxin family protein n=1 Tax=Ningiella ruwaisensis TaxID=2364274 RepID=UPI00109FADB1|nr:MbcA/ParS/Xre antitoxin family protein [Ningiella ruwaisensis]